MSSSSCLVGVLLVSRVRAHGCVTVFMFVFMFVVFALLLLLLTNTLRTLVRRRVHPPEADTQGRTEGGDEFVHRTPLLGK